MCQVYILKSEKSERHYIGHTSNLPKRLARHNSGQVKSTKAFMPWKVVYTESFADKKSAYARETQIKSYKGGVAFKSLIK